ncbi:hypothetical protein [Acinetobacter stercoris]|uniref:Uncharacterized protein n=1 Tax=Acinetobacter stercoris TaxID=2126983 RepID=A0A2U3N0V9_9GAMM|nr:MULTISPECIES: hypothetical protein [Acinetobacter]SPL71317.1 hypothetical protein KPC_2495 [Acinetobacter stercoris]
MKQTSSSDDTESSILGWKFVAIVGVLTAIFFTCLFLAMSKEPDYMPSQKRKAAIEQNAQSHASQPVDQNTSK